MAEGSIIIIGRSVEMRQGTDCLSSGEEGRGQRGDWKNRRKMGVAVGGKEDLEGVWKNAGNEEGEKST